MPNYNVHQFPIFSFVVSASDILYNKPLLVPSNEYISLFFLKELWFVLHISVSNLYEIDFCVWCKVELQFFFFISFSLFLKFCFIFICV